MRNKHIVIPEELHMELKLKAARSGVPMKNLILRILQGEKPHEKKPLRW